MSAYYNENDREKAEWIRQLMKAGVIAPGEVDERSIEQVEPGDLRGFRQCHFFAGIAVWSYALRLAGWPDDRPVWTGSCPCPSFSAAGKGAGFNDPRHLWPQWFRLIRECKPSIVFGEQVNAAIGHGWLDLVSLDLEGEAYAVAAAVLGACSVGGSDIRQRLYWVADSVHEGLASEQDRGENERFSTDYSVSARSETDRLAKPLHSERRPLYVDREDGRDGEDHRRPEAHGESGTRSEVLGLANTESGGRGMLWSASGETGHTESSDELDRSGRTYVEHFAADALKGFWRTADWLFCTDGRWRPVEAGTFPLADGAPGRLGRLRGYGDAINAQVAKEFIKAYTEVRFQF